MRPPLVEPCSHSRWNEASSTVASQSRMRIRLLGGASFSSHHSEWKTSSPWPDMQDLINHGLQYVARMRPSAQEVFDRLCSAEFVSLKRAISVQHDRSVETFTVRVRQPIPRSDLCLLGMFTVYCVYKIPINCFEQSLIPTLLECEIQPNSQALQSTNIFHLPSKIGNSNLSTQLYGICLYFIVCA